MPPRKGNAARTTCAFIDACVPAQARRSPLTYAIESDAEQLTYGDLDGQVERIASGLLALRLPPASIIGVCLTRSARFVSAVLGVMRAGHAYLALDPGYPPERIRYMVTDSRARLVVAEPVVLDRLASCDTPLKLVDALEERPGDLVRHPPRTDAYPAYVVYTSGSTGLPKGVVVDHGALRQYGRALPSLVDTSANRYLHSASVAFSASVRQMFMPLLNGGTLYMASDEERVDVDRLLAVLERGNIEVWDTTPTVLRTALTVLAESGRCLPESLRWVLVTGEVLPSSTAVRLHAAASEGVRLVNLYSQSETCGTVAAGVVRPDGADLSAAPTGTPLDGVEVSILDGRMAPVSAGLSGDLWVGGLRLAQQYVQDAALTAERFRPDPNGRPGARTYRTGDAGTVLPDGRLLVTGRTDGVVNVAGMRVAPSEIEAAVLRDVRVREVAVVAAGDKSSAVRLHAFVVPLPSVTTFAAARVRAQLAAWLPRHMMPARIEVVTALPRLPSGKVDRHALVRVCLEAQLAMTPHTPLDGTEAAVASCFASVLDVPRVERDADFFEAGGDSLAATLMISRLRRVTGRSLRMRDFFANPTVAGLASLLDSPRLTEVDNGDDAIPRTPLIGRLPLSHAQERLWFLEQLDPGTAMYNVSRALRVRGPVDIASLRESVRTVVSRHSILAARFGHEGGRPFQEITVADVAVREVTLDRRLDRTAALDAARRVAEDEIRKPFDLATPPLLRVLCVHLGGDEHLLSFTVHHIVCDGWSIGLMLSEIGRHYRALMSGTAAEVPPLSIHFVDFVRWERSWVDRRAHVEESYWRHAMAACTSLPPLPTDYARPPVLTHDGALFEFDVPQLVSTQLRSICRTSRTTLFMTLATGFAALLASFSRIEQILIGTPIANRPRIETEPVIGFFANTLVLCIDLAGDPTLDEALQRVRTTVLEAHEHQHLPFERLVRAVEPARHPDRIPLIHAIFGYQDLRREALALSGTVEEVVNAHSATSKCDLLLTVADRDDRLRASFEYNPNLYRLDTIQSLATDLLACLSTMAAGQPARVSSIAGTSRRTPTQ
jgi:amino acid adenylation domain-containing protein